MLTAFESWDLTKELEILTSDKWEFEGGVVLIRSKDRLTLYCRVKGSRYTAGFSQRVKGVGDYIDLYESNVGIKCDGLGRKLPSLELTTNRSLGIKNLARNIKRRILPEAEIRYAAMLKVRSLEDMSKVQFRTNVRRIEAEFKCSDTASDLEVERNLGHHRVNMYGSKLYPTVTDVSVRRDYTRLTIDIPHSAEKLLKELVVLLEKHTAA